jgi:hypothetical protein
MDENEISISSREILIAIFANMPKSLKKKGVPEFLLQIVLYNLSLKERYSFIGDYWSFANEGNYPFSFSLSQDLETCCNDRIIESVTFWTFFIKNSIVKTYNERKFEMFTDETIEKFGEIAKTIAEENECFLDIWGIKEDKKDNK